MKYQEQLKDKRWVYKRFEIMKRDNFKCLKCSDNKNLQVHHTKYTNGKMAWEYKAYILLTLCDSCHTKHHKNGLSLTDIEQKIKTQYLKAERKLRELKKDESAIEKISLLDTIERLEERITVLESEVFGTGL